MLLLGLGALLVAAASIGPAFSHEAGQPAPTSRPAAAPPTAGTGRVVGRLNAGSANLPEIVVYLESLDPQQRFSVPTLKAAISQKGASFSPALLIICVGQTVEFPNDEDRPVQHNVFSNSPGRPFDLGHYGPGRSKSVTFDKPGPVQLGCAIHAEMEGMVFVSPTPFFARAAKDGTFALEGVAAGEYELRTWQPNKRFLDRSVRISVRADQPVTVNIELSRT